LIEPLGRGSQGEVWRALQVEPDRRGGGAEAALSRRVKHAAYRSQFHREAEWAARPGEPVALPATSSVRRRASSSWRLRWSTATRVAAVIVRPPPALAGFRHAPIEHWLDRLSAEAYLRAVVAITLGSPGRRQRRMRNGWSIATSTGQHLDRPMPRGWQSICVILAWAATSMLPLPRPGGTGNRHHPCYMAPNACSASRRRDPLRRLRAGRDGLAEAVDARPSVRGSRDLPPASGRNSWHGTAADADPSGPPAACVIESIIGRALRRDPGDRYPS